MRVVNVPSTLTEEDYDVFTWPTVEYLEDAGYEVVSVYPDGPSLREQKSKLRDEAEEGDFLYCWSSGCVSGIDEFASRPSYFSGIILLEPILDWYNNPKDQVLMTSFMGLLPREARNKIASNEKFIKTLLDDMIEAEVHDRDKRNMVKSLKEQGGERLVDAVLDIRDYTRFANYKPMVRKLDQEHRDKIHWLTTTELSKDYVELLGVGNHTHINDNHMPGYAKTGRYKPLKKIYEIVEDAAKYG